jgi:CO/xanthine dehydrogenase Mo-binding subunit
MGAFASKTMYLAGNAVRVAAFDARGQLLRHAQSRLEAGFGELDIVDGYIVILADPLERCMPIGDLVLQNPERIGRHIVGRGFWESQNTDLFNRETGYGNTCGTYSFGAHAVEVSVDEETGEVSVLRVAAAHDVGRAINPTAVEGQVEGGTMQGLGFALWENHRWDDTGQVMTNNFEKYGIPTIRDTPAIQTFIVETDDDTGPYSANGVGEPAMVAPPAAIANAVYDAVGVRITSLPITAEKVLSALRSTLADTSSG